MWCMSRRLSLTLDTDDELAITPFVVAGPERDWLASFAHGTLNSDAAVLRALIRVGAQAAREHALDRGYAQWAADLSEDEQAEKRGTRARQRKARARRDQRND